MPQCTARVRGHRTQGGMDKCPIHRGGSLGAYRSSAASPATQSGQPSTRGNSTQPQQSNSLASSPPSARASLEIQVAERVTHLVAVGLLNGCDESVIDSAVDFAIKYDEARPGCRPTHALCRLLASMADLLGGQAAGSVVQEVVRNRLLARGYPAPISHAGGIAAGRIAEKIAEQLLPNEQFAVSVRVLAFVLCPEPDRCPSKEEIAGELMKKILIIPEG